MYKNIYITMGTLLAVLIFNYCSTTKNKPAVVISQPQPVTLSDFSLTKKLPVRYLPVIQDSVSSITINLVGDLMCHLPQTNNAKVTGGGYDFSPSFEYIKPFLQSADITIGNLETTFAGPAQPYAGYPAFNSPDEYAAALKNAGFDFLVTANNHSMDTREAGLLRTIDVIKQNKLGYAGTYVSQADHDSVRVLNIKGIKLGILNYTYGTNGSYPAHGHKFMLNVIDSAGISEGVKNAKQKGADIVMVFYHMGVENVVEPTQAQKDAVKYALSAGAALVIGAHPHVVGPTKKMFSPVLKDTAFIAYSLGNFLSNQYWRYTDAGVIMEITLQKNFTKNVTSFKKVQYVPTWVYRGDGVKKMHIVFPAQYSADSIKLPAFLTGEHIFKMKEAFNDTKSTIQKYNPEINVKSVN